MTSKYHDVRGLHPRLEPASGPCDLRQVSGYVKLSQGNVYLLGDLCFYLFIF